MTHAIIPYGIGFGKLKRTAPDLAPGLSFWFLPAGGLFNHLLEEFAHALALPPAVRLGLSHDRFLDAKGELLLHEDQRYVIMKRVRTTAPCYTLNAPRSNFHTTATYPARTTARSPYSNKPPRLVTPSAAEDPHQSTTAPAMYSSTRLTL